VLILHAPNVHQGGGRTLLLPLLQALSGREDVRANLDARLLRQGYVPEGIRARAVEPGLASRLRAEWSLRATDRPGDTVLCFGNLPPLFRLSARVVVFLQNRYLIEGLPLAGFSWRAWARIRVERLWLAGRSGVVDRWVVQGRTMARLLEQRLGRQALVAPFAEPAGAVARTSEPRRDGSGSEFDFLYVASGEPHKNHRCLVEAWRELARQGLRPSLVLTLNEEDCPALRRWVRGVAQAEGLRIEMMGATGADEVPALYRRSGALIFPSLAESLGLPLVEARRAGLPVLASERDYVRDLLDPEEAFDPLSPTSIARAVRRFLGRTEAPVALLDAESFVQRVLDA